MGGTSPPPPFPSSTFLVRRRTSIAKHIPRSDSSSRPSSSISSSTQTSPQPQATLPASATPRAPPEPLPRVYPSSGNRPIKRRERADEVHPRQAFGDSAMFNMHHNPGDSKAPQQIAVSGIVMNVKHGRHPHFQKAFNIFQQFLQEGGRLSKEAFISIFLACSSPESLALGRQVHEHAIRRGMESDVAVGTALVVMYGKCGSLEDAMRMFSKLRQRNVVAWTAMIGACAQHGYADKAFKLFHGMQQEGVEPNKITFISILSSCSSPGALAWGKQAHALLVANGMDSDVFTENALLSMYSRCNSIEDARRVFDKMRQRDVVSWNAMIAAYTRHGYGKEALELFHKMQKEGVKPDKITFISILKACSSPEALAVGKYVHTLIVGSGANIDVVLGTALVSMYGKCGSIKDAQRVFNEMHHRNVISWNALIATYARHGLREEVLTQLQRMQEEGVKPDNVTYIKIFNACSSPETKALGKQVHALITDTRIESDVTVGTALVSMYGNSGNIEDALRVFNKIGQRDVVSWNAMITAYARHGYGKEALDLFHGIRREGLKPDKTTFISILNACSGPEDLAFGGEVYALIVKSGFLSDVVVGTALVSMYGKCGSIGDASRLFDKMPQRNVVSWNAMITVCAQHGNAEEALKIFHRMHQEGVNPNTVTFISILNACRSLDSLALGKQIHALIAGNGMESDDVIGSALVSMYGRCGSIEDASSIFSKMPQRNVASWNAMIAAFAQHGLVEEAYKHIHIMQQEGLKPDKFTFVSIFNGCSSPKVLGIVKQVHALIVDHGMETDVIVGNALITVYGNCSSIEDARIMFDKMCLRDVISWTAMIGACAQHGHGDEAFKLFRKMQQEGLKPNKITFISILNACSRPEALKLGKQVHAQIVDNAVESDVVVGNALVSMYSKTGSINDAWRVFNRMHKKDVVSWNVMIAAYAQHGYGEEALKLLHRMQNEGEKPDRITFISILNACNSLAVLTLGKRVHAHVVEKGMESDIVVGSALVNMYSKCGSMEDARQMFIKMHERDLVSWNTMISACAQHGFGKQALQLFGQMQREGMKPDAATVTSLLCGCSHAKLVDEGLCFFHSMSQEYGITPTVEHCNCIVDLLGRAGWLDEAEDFINRMPCQPNAVTWMTLLGSCRVYGCIEQGKRAAEHALQLDPQLAPAYVVLSNIYAAANRWEDVAKVRKMMVDRGVKKETGCSWIEFNNRVHEFIVNDRSHPQTMEIYSELKNLTVLMKEAGYVPNTESVLHHVEEGHKEELLCHHSEKLAIVFGHINLPAGEPIRIMKNQRVCLDCHTATKFISKLVRRDIFLRDANRFHHFKNGFCSCGDYW